MAKEIKQLGIINPEANTEVLAFEQGSPGLFVVSVIASNYGMTDAKFDITIFNASASTNNAILAKKQPLPARNSYETQKFTLDYSDEIYVMANSSSVSFMISGVNQSEA